MFSLASAAAVTCAIMNPELIPLSRTRNAGRRLKDASIKRAVRRSDMEPISAIATASASAASATGSAWKLPPESSSPVSAKTSGLSEVPLASVRSTCAA